MLFSHFRFCFIQTGFELDCFYEALLGKDSSEESSSKDNESELTVCENLFVLSCYEYHILLYQVWIRLYLI